MVWYSLIAMPEVALKWIFYYPKLEDYIRKLVRAGIEVYVVMGCYGVGGTGIAGTKQTIDAGRVTVPAQIWKVLVVLAEGNDDLNRITTSTRAIAINTPNINSVNPAWGNYRTSVDVIEKEIGNDLLSAIPDNIQQEIEGKIDNRPTQ